MKFLVHRLDKRKAVGKNTVFRVRGREVDPAKIKRFRKRRGILESELAEIGG
jgi:hypothetical protein